MDRKEHWERVYATRLVEKLGWYKPSLDIPLAWIETLQLDKGAPIIDIGGGASTLIDDLVDEGYEALTVLDLSVNALEASKKRLGRQSELVMWLSADVTRYPLPEKHFELWHDRAAFHFLVEPVARQAYLDNLMRALKPCGQVIFGVFAPEAPPKCSGLPVVRYDHEHLAAFMGDEFELVKWQKELHVTPGGVEQMYLYCLFHRLG